MSALARVAGRSNSRVPAYRFGIVLLLLFATFIFLATGPTGDWVPLVAVILQGATLLAALSASGAHRTLWRIAVAIVVVSMVSATIGLVVGEKQLTGSLFVLNLLLVAGAPVVIIQSLVRRRVIDIRTECSILRCLGWPSITSARGDRIRFMVPSLSAPSRHE